jgi:adenylate cyclase
MISRRSYASRSETNFQNSPFLQHPARSRRGKRLDAASDYDQSLTAAQRAIAIDPNFAPGYASLAYVLESSGRSAEAVVVLKKGMRLDPSNNGWPWYLLIEGLAYTYMGRYEEAIPVFKEDLAHRPNDLIAHEWLAASYAGVGRLDDARAEAAEVMRISPSFSLETQKRFSIVKKGPMLDRNYAYMAQAGLK